MNKEEYICKKGEALRLIADDYQWVLHHIGKPLRWTATQGWLLEFVHDASDLLQPLDEMLRPLGLNRQYAAFCQAVGHPMPHSPAVALSKLHAQELRHGISPDYITRFYMNHLDDEDGKRPIFQLLEMEEEKLP